MFLIFEIDETKTSNAIKTHGYFYTKEAAINYCASCVKKENINCDDPNDQIIKLTVGIDIPRYKNKPNTIYKCDNNSIEIYVLEIKLITESMFETFLRKVEQRLNKHPIICRDVIQYFDISAHNVMLQKLCNKYSVNLDSFASSHYVDFLKLLTELSLFHDQITDDLVSTVTLSQNTYTVSSIQCLENIESKLLKTSKIMF